MLFAHDTDLALAATAALINTGRDGGDTMTSVADLVDFLDTQGYSGRRDGDDAELDAVRKLRGASTRSGGWTSTTWPARSTTSCGSPTRGRT